MAEEFKYPHIGQMISEELSEQMMTKTDLGGLIGMSQSNAIYLTSRANIDVMNLHKISVALGHNFFKYYPVKDSSEQPDAVVENLKGKVAELQKQLEQS